MLRKMEQRKTDQKDMGRWSAILPFPVSVSNGFHLNAGELFVELLNKSLYTVVFYTACITAFFGILFKRFHWHCSGTFPLVIVKSPYNKWGSAQATTVLLYLYNSYSVHKCSIQLWSHHLRKHLSKSKGCQRANNDSTLPVLQQMKLS